MKHRQAISILLTFLLAVGAGLGPRFLCVCADGTATTQFGDQFCCDGPGEAPCPIPSEDGEDASHSVACSDGRCQSTEVESESIVAVDRLEKDTDKDWSFDGPDDPTFPWFEFLTNGSASTTFIPRPPVPLDVGTSGCHLRSVILLV
jgi:hypothetical protein